MPVGEVALEWLNRWIDEAGRRCLAARHHVEPRPRRPAVPGRPRPAARPRQQAWARSSSAPRGRAGLAERGQPAHPAALVRDPSARGRGRPARRPGVARACEYQHDAAVHPSDRGADPRGLRSGPSPGLRREDSPWPATRTDCSRTASHPAADPPALVRRSSTARIAFWALVLARRSAASCSADVPSWEVFNWITLISARGRPRRSWIALVATAYGWSVQDYIVTNRRVIKVEGILNKRLGRQLAREDQRRGARAEPLRADLRLRRPRHPDRRGHGGRRFRMLNEAPSSRRRCSTRSTALEREVMAPMPSPPLRAPSAGLGDEATGDLSGEPLPRPDPAQRAGAGRGRRGHPAMTRTCRPRSDRHPPPAGRPARPWRDQRRRSTSQEEGRAPRAMAFHVYDYVLLIGSLDDVERRR